MDYYVQSELTTNHFNVFNFSDGGRVIVVGNVINMMRVLPGGERHLKHFNFYNL